VSKPALLLVDDAPDLGVIVTALGRRCGCEVAWRPDGASAWEYLQTARPDLILLDVGLPGESGLELCRRLRAFPPLADLRVALFSHWGLPAVVAAGLDAGADFLLSKDLVCKPDEWQRRLREALSWRRGEPAEAPGGPPRPAADWVACVNQALAHPSLRRAGPDVVRVLLRRALREALPGHALADSWLSPGGAALDGVPPLAAAEAEALVCALADLAWRLLGADASAAFRSALAGAVTAS
jgi:DNA-binding response OmpR family regulator